MRRFMLLGLCLGLLGLSIGCHHTAGVCDCEGPRDWCYYGPRGGAGGGCNGCNGTGHANGHVNAYANGPIGGTIIAPIPATPLNGKTPEQIKELPKEAPKGPDGAPGF